MTKSKALSTVKPKENGLARDERGLFLPGNAGGGRKALSPEVREILALASPRAARVMVEALEAMLPTGLPDHEIRVKAGNAILDRLHGRPPQAITGADGETPRFNLIVMPAKNDE